MHARWNSKIISALLSGVTSSLQRSGVLPSNTFVYDVPGSFELPLAVQRASLYKQNPFSDQGSRPDAIIAIGVLIKGETMHFEYISEAVTHGLMRVQLDTGIPVVFGVLTALNEEQALARAGLGGQTEGEGERGHNHGEDWAYAAIELAAKSSGVGKSPGNL